MFDFHNWVQKFSGEYFLTFFKYWIFAKQMYAHICNFANSEPKRARNGSYNEKI